MKPLVIALLFVVPVAAHAEAFRCFENGKTVISDTPCRKVLDLPKYEVDKTAAQLQAEFEAEQEDIKEGQRLRAEIAANKAKDEADKKQKLDAGLRACAAEKSKPAVVTNSGWDGSVHQVKRFLDKTLRDPDSFEAIDWGRVTRTCEGYSTWVKYRARNGFGGMVISTQFFTLDRNGVVTGVK